MQESALPPGKERPPSSPAASSPLSLDPSPPLLWQPRLWPPLPPRLANAATLTVTETDTEILVDNGPVHLTVSKTSPARLTVLRFEGQDLLGSGGRGNYDMNNAREGDASPLPPAQNTYQIRRGSDGDGDDFVDIALRYSPTNGGRSGSSSGTHRAGPGAGPASGHGVPAPAELHGFRSDQHRYVSTSTRCCSRTPPSRTIRSAIRGGPAPP